MPDDSIERFRRAAQNFCDAIRNAGQRSREKLPREIVRTLIDVYAAALALPDPDWTAPDIEVPERREFTRLQQIKDAFGEEDTFREVWHPYDRDRPIKSSISQQLAEIYDDLEEAEALLEQHGPSPGAVHEVSWAFHNHWGKHAVDILRPLHVLTYGPPA